MNWIISSNSKIFQLTEAFKKREYIDWRQKVKFNIGDIVYIYCTKPLKKVMFKTIVDKVNIDFEDMTDDKEFWVNKQEYEERENCKYSRLRLLKNIDTKKLELDILMKNGLKAAPQGPARIDEQLNKYISEIFKEYSKNTEESVNINKYQIRLTNCEKNSDLPYEREIISIPAAGTIDLIYKYKIHAHPNNAKSYPYKKSLYYTFREKNGWMKKLFTLETMINLNPHNYEMNNINIDYEAKERLCGYIKDRSNSFKFSNEGEYKFYILGESLELPKAVSLPKQNNHAYFTISEMYSGKDIVERSNKDIVIEDENGTVEDANFSEGKLVSVKVNKYERSPKAREKCLEHHGYKCSVCGFNFEEFYGSIGKEVIEVHHKKALYEIKESYVVDPINDLIPVCSNCHTIIHHRNPKFEIDELKSLINKKNKNKI
ncbi:HNH endonuclease [Clostridium sporogenes]|uniref:HNH endonuclease n=1 Tax=Clostridium sporogenes TaxID=1509 RepID=UPI0005F02E28|nr:HNH endonuclease [Clostridium sporogenes]NFQ68148.1 HNH endonuclease [Clostridium sporogenes]NFU79146.1 HNH endonuclease [Clostridium sporogenes]